MAGMSRASRRLLTASRDADVAAVTALLRDQNVNVNVRSEEFDRTPLHLIASREYPNEEYVDMQHQAAKHSAKGYAANRHTAKKYASERVKARKTTAKYAKVVALLLEKGADPTCVDRDERTPLICAAAMGHYFMVCQLTGSESRDIASSNQNATGNGDLYTKKSVFIDAEDKNGRTALSWAAEQGYRTIVLVLLEKGASIDSTDRHGRTPLSWAVWNGQDAMVRVLLRKGANIEGNNPEAGEPESKKRVPDWTPVWWAVAKGHGSLVRLLLQEGAGIDRISNGWTPLSWTVWHGEDDAMASLLLGKGGRLHDGFQVDGVLGGYALGFTEINLISALLKTSRSRLAAGYNVEDTTAMCPGIFTLNQCPRVVFRIESAGKEIQDQWKIVKDAVKACQGKQLDLHAPPRQSLYKLDDGSLLIAEELPHLANDEFVSGEQWLGHQKRVEGFKMRARLAESIENVNMFEDFAAYIVTSLPRRSKWIPAKIISVPIQPRPLLKVSAHVFRCDDLFGLIFADDQDKMVAFIVHIASYIALDTKFPGSVFAKEAKAMKWSSYEQLRVLSTFSDDAASDFSNFYCMFATYETYFPTSLTDFSSLQ